ncbi:hypothetical protein HMPREF9056_01951 [Actinomyces sp. oral taxon 170 str. F0386]|nr:hypothetical protein HMPREF9056_01951 [Actinomyces sp. oral taxon 170 str. F0386]
MWSTGRIDIPVICRWPRGLSRLGCSLESVLPRRGAPNLSWVRGAPASG